MKIISLNIWGGRLESELLTFFKQYQDVDVFCLQEVYHQAPARISQDDGYVSLDILSKIQAILPDHNVYFCPTVKGVYGLVILIKKHISVLSQGDKNVYENPKYPGMGPTHDRKIQWLTVLFQKRPFAILNFHGLWNGLGKVDTHERIEQSFSVKAKLLEFDHPYLICGDFNLSIKTQSLAILEAGLVNCIRTHNIKSTRTRYYPKPEKMADYVLYSSGLAEQQFAVLPDVVSDHAALFIEIAA